MLNKLKTSYTFKYTLFVAVCLLASSILSLIILVISIQISEASVRRLNILLYTIIVFIVSFVLGTIIAFFVSKQMSKQQKEFENVVKEVVSGNFDVELSKTNGPNKYIFEGINAMIKELKNVSILKSDFISNFSHEFKTPIVSINGFSELLLSEDLPKKTQKEYLQIIYDESKRLSKLSNNMLLLSNLESSAIVPQKTEFELDKQIKSTVKLLNAEFSKKNLTISLKLENAKIIANSDMLQQVWINLLSNAIKYTNPKGIVRVSLSKSEHEIEVKVADNGIGIPKENIDYVFDKFYQCDQSRKTEGNGLGLAIAKQIVELHGGTISVQSEENVGTEFKVVFKI